MIASKVRAISPVAVRTTVGVPKAETRTQVESLKDGTLDLSWWDWLTNIMTTDPVAICTLIVSAIAFFCSVWWIRRQAQAFDINNYFRFKDEFSDAWRRVRDESEEKRDFELAEILNLLESASHLYNKRTIHGATREMVQDYLCEVITDVFKNEKVKSLFKESHSGPKTYAEIRRFARKHKIKGVPRSNPNC